MSVYVITGVSKGIGFELLKQISSDPSNTIIGLVRNVASTKQKVTTELGNRANVHILHADLTKRGTLAQAAASTAAIVGSRGIDYLIANGAFLSLFDAYGPIGSIATSPTELDATFTQIIQTNVIGNIHLFTLFPPLTLLSPTKKVITLSSGHADLDLINSLEIDNSALYAASKAAMNVIVAKFSTQYKKEVVLFFSLSPGAVEVGHFADASPEQMQGATGWLGKLATYAPEFKGPLPVEEGIRNIRKVWEEASIEGGYAGAFVSHFGNKQWL